MNIQVEEPASRNGNDAITSSAGVTSDNRQKTKIVLEGVDSSPENDENIDQ